MSEVKTLALSELRAVFIDAFTKARSENKDYPNCENAGILAVVNAAVLAAASEKGRSQWIEECAEAIVAEHFEGESADKRWAKVVQINNLIHKHAPALGGWVKCGDRLPEEKAHVLAWHPGSSQPSWQVQFRRGKFEDCNSGCAWPVVTHWQPLPLPPMPEGRSA